MDQPFVDKVCVTTYKLYTFTIFQVVHVQYTAQFIIH